MNSNSKDISKVTFSEEQCKYLEKLFPSITVDEDISINKITLNTGERSVVAIVKANIGFTARRSHWHLTFSRATQNDPTSRH